MNASTEMTQKVQDARSRLTPLANFGSGLFSIPEVAAMTKTSEETLRRAIRSGAIPAYGSPAACGSGSTTCYPSTCRSVGGRVMTEPCPTCARAGV